MCQLPAPMGVRLLLFGLMGPFAAAFINRYGVRNVTVTALGLIASGLARCASPFDTAHCDREIPRNLLG
jgi:hypothetical protein